MSDIIQEQFIEEYHLTLYSYLEGKGGEHALLLAYNYGRKAIEMKLSLSEITMIHHAQLLSFILGNTIAQKESKHYAEMADEFFREVLVSYEIVKLGFAEANVELKELNTTLERLVAERTKELRESGERKTAIVESALDGIITIDHQGKIIEFNPGAEKIFGYTQTEVLGKEMVECIIPSSQWEKNRQEIMHFLTTGEGAILGKRTEIIGMKSDGTKFPVELSFTRIGQMDPPLFTGFLCDITERKKSEERNHQLAYIVESSNDAIIGKTLDGIITSWNKGAEKIYGYSSAEVIGKSIALLVPKETTDEFSEIIKKIKNSEQIIHYETKRVKKNRQAIDVSLTISLVKDSQGKILGVSTIARDITERKKAEEGLKLFRSLLDQSNDTIEVVDPETGCFLDINEKGCMLHGYTRAEYLSLKVSDIDPLVDPATFGKVSEKLRESGQAIFESIHRRKDGTTFPVEVNLKFIRLDRDYILNVVRDITERKKSEEEKEIQLQRINSLRNIDMAIASSLDLKLTLNVVLDQVIQQLKVDAADILLMNPHTHTLEYAAGHGFRTRALQQTRLRLGEGLAGKTALDRKIHYIPDLQERRQ
jgi:PAS domain S-box-containing protein